MLRPITAACEDGRQLEAESPELRSRITDDDEPIVYCEARWEREFGEKTV
jgi:hypothetical protein